MFCCFLENGFSHAVTLKWITSPMRMHQLCMQH
ncbi:hypothetical protein CUMW_279480 [Citrus unshiu]|uniref:Uncharacterized protein n=1 Tax=Citrus unshiu TaxID=55188 RepID=A0A2H5N7K5_CITUN|nr:hypothetical protein CUMW_279480 [Citrus unshiu]